MNLIKSSILLGLSFILTCTVSLAGEVVVRIPLKTFIKPAFDLVDSLGRPLNTTDLSRMFQKGEDLSKLNPTENKYWQNKKFSATDVALYAEMPSDQDTVEFDDFYGANRELGIFSVFVKPSSHPDQRYGLTFGLQVHSSLTKAALLRKLGLYQESPKYLHTIKIKFTSEEQMNDFVKKTFCEKGPSDEDIDCLSVATFKRGFITDLNASQKTLVMHGAYLEKLNPEFPGIFDGLTPASANTLPYFTQSRAFRSLLVPFVVADVGESLNRFSPQSVMIRGGWAYMNFLNSEYFENITSDDDARWMIRRMAALTNQDWDEIVQAGAFPIQLRELVKTKLIYRMKNMIESFFNEAEQAELLKVEIPPLKMNSGDGVVVDGKVMTQAIAGYPQRFSHGDRQSPFESADLIKYMKIKTQSSVIQVALNRLGEKLNVTNQLTQNITGIEFTKSGVRPIGSVSGNSFGINFNANRIITTGTYYGSQAPVQMVDTVSLSAAMGYNNLLFAAGGLSRNAGANLAYVRDYTHVTPLTSIKETSKIPWADLVVPSKLHVMTAPLKDGKLTEFINGLKIGEVFTITDSIGVLGRVGWTSSLDALLSFTTVTQSSVTLSGDTSSVILRQIQFTKTNEGLQIFVRDQNVKAYGVQFDANYFINLMRIRSQTTKADLHTDAFLINFNAELMQKVDKNELTPDENVQKIFDSQKEIIGKASAALRALLFQSNKDPIYENFSHERFEIDHGLKTKEIQTKILWFRSTQFEEEHLLTIKKTEVAAPDGSTVDNKPIQIVTYRKGELRGRDILGFGLDVFDGFLKQQLKNNAPSLSQNSQNPSQMPFGNAEWRMIRSDTELTQDRVGALPSVSIIEHVWGGWSLSKAKLDQILAQVKENMKGTQFADYPLLPEGALAQVTKIDFFRVTSHLTLLPAAFEKIRDLILAPEAKNLPTDKFKYLGRLFQKLSELNGKAKPEDKAVFNHLMRIFGNGDEKNGYLNYLNQCQMNKNNGYTYQWLNGTGYDCLEPWVEKLLKLSRSYPENNLRLQNQWMTEILFVLDEKIPQSYLLNELGKEKFIYYVEVTGFRAGDEDGDDGSYVSNVLGEPAKKSDYANGLISVFSQKSNINPVELDRTQGSFQ